MTITPQDFTAQYLKVEAIENRKPQGADHKAILAELAKAHGIPYDTARAWVLDNTYMGGAG